MCRPCCQKPVAKTNHCFVTMFGKLVKWGMISRCTHLATTVHLFTVSNVTSCTFQSVCICLHLSIYPSSQSDKPLCSYCRQLPMTTVRCTISREVDLWRAWASRAYVWLLRCCVSENMLRSWVQGVFSHQTHYLVLPFWVLAFLCPWNLLCCHGFNEWVVHACL